MQTDELQAKKSVLLVVENLPVPYDRRVWQVALALKAADYQVSVVSPATKQFPKLALQMISVGEESGELEAMLMKVADTFDVEVKNTLDRLLAALVPATTIVMTVVVAMIMLAIVLPIMNIAGAVH